MLDFLKDSLRPSTITCVLALLTPGVVLLLIPRVTRWGRRWVTAVALFYLVISSEAGARLLAATLSGGYESIIIRRMLAERGITVFVLVTSPLHMRRSMLVFRQQGLDPIPSTSLLVPERTVAWNPLLPADKWLDISDSVLYEWIARGYYWW